MTLQAADPGTTLDRWRRCWQTPWHLAVAHGPDAGWLHPLAAGGRCAIGRSTAVDLPLADPYLSPRHIEVAVQEHRVRVRRAASGAEPVAPVRLERPAPTGWVDRLRVRRRRVGRWWRTVHPGEAILAGSSRIELRAPPLPAGAPAPAPARGRRPGRWLMLVPLVLLVTLPLRSACRWLVPVLLGLGAVAVAVAAVALVRWLRRRGKGAGGGQAGGGIEAGCDPAAFALWCAGTGRAPGAPRNTERHPEGHPEGPAYPVHAGTPDASPLLLTTRGAAVTGQGAADLARWLRLQLPAGIPVRVAGAGQVPPGAFPVLPTTGRLGVSTPWAQVVARAQGHDEESPALLDLLGRPGADEIARAWSAPIAPGTLAVPVGRAGRGPVELDLAGHGPHALVAGTTGSGKSELLASWVLALATANAPREVTFLLVDYKGGSTFHGLGELPHCVGLLTDLDAGASRRALRSLRFELRRRERLLAEAGVSDRDTLVATGRHLARLVVVVDELRALVEDDAERLADLVAVATLGRSLGIHLILATQRPSGVVSGQLRANLPLRVCLRVIEGADSVDVIGTPDAAGLTRPGAAYLGSSREAVQLAWLPGQDRDRLRESIVGAAHRVRRARRPGLLEVSRPWLPELPRRVTREEAAGMLLLDRPQESAHVPWRWPGGLLVVSGPRGSGRTTALGAAQREAAGAGAGCHVLAAAGWPARFGIASSAHARDPQLLARLLPRLSAGKDADAGIVIDDLERVIEAVDAVTRPGVAGEAVRELVAMRREGWLALGLEVPRRWAEAASHHLVLGLHDAAAATLAGVPRAFVQAGAPPGRGVLLQRGLAELAQVVTGEAGWEAARSHPDPAAALMRLQPVPGRVSAAALTPPARVTDSGEWLIGLGIGGEDATVVHAGLVPGRPWLVLGPPGSGRTTVLRTISRGVAHLGGRPVTATGLTGDQLAPEEVLILDDAERLDAIGPAAQQALHSGRCVVATTPAALSTTFRGVLAMVREARTVVALGACGLPELDPARVPRGSGRPGSGHLIEHGRVRVLQVAAPDQS